MASGMHYILHICRPIHQSTFISFVLSRVNLHLIRGTMKGALFTIRRVVSKYALHFDKLEFVLHYSIIFFL